MTTEGGERGAAICVSNTSEIPVGQMKGFAVAGKQILVANVGGQYFAMDAVCSHAGGYLPAGHLDNDVVTCPNHGAQFDVTTGCMVIHLAGKVRKNVNADCRLSAGHNIMDLHTYEIMVDGNEIKVRI